MISLIIYIISISMRLMSCYTFNRKMLVNHKFSKKIDYLYIFSAAFILLLVDVSFRMWELNVLICTMVLISMPLFFTENYIKKLKIIATVLAVNIIADGSLSFMVYYGNMSEPSYNLIGVISSWMITSMLLFIYKTYLIISQYKFNYKKAVLVILFNLFSLTLILATTIYVFDHMAAVLILLLVATNYGLYAIYNIYMHQLENRHNQGVLEQQNKAYKMQLDLIETSQKQMRQLKHDIKYHHHSIQTMLHSGDYKECIQYIDKLYDYISPSQPTIDTGNIAVDSILNYKIQKLSSVNSKFDLDVKIPADINIDATDFTVILGNLMDNAYEAIREDSRKQISLTLDYYGGMLFLTVKNTFTSIPKRQRGRFISTKINPFNHGIGLTNVKTTVEKYNGHMDIDTSDNWFTVDIALYCTSRENANIHRSSVAS